MCDLCSTYSTHRNLVSTKGPKLLHDTSISYNSSLLRPPSLGLLGNRTKTLKNTQKLAKSDFVIEISHLVVSGTKGHVYCPLLNIFIDHGVIQKLFTIGHNDK